MSDVVLIDTSAFCELLRVPGRSDEERHQDVREELELGAEDRWQFLLPWATILETGNHIGQVPAGGSRREVAQRFVSAVRRSLDGTAPWSPAAPLDHDRIRRLLEEFVEWVTTDRGGLGDLSIVEEYERQVRLSRGRRVRIWSLDRHLAGYDTGEPGVS